MLHELAFNEYHKVRPILHTLSFNVAIDAIIDGTIPGRIWVDDVTTPHTAFIWNKTSDGDWYLEGNEQNAEFNRALNAVIHETIYPEAKVQQLTVDFTMRYSPQSWEGKSLETILSGTHPRKDTRRFFRFKQLGVNWRSLALNGLSLHQVDHALLEDNTMDVGETLRKQILKSWLSVEQFLQHRIGFCLLADNKLVGWCLADWVSESRCDLGIWIHEEYRKQGYATLLAAATVEYCLAHHITFIGWHCWSDNIASAATAQKVGFEHVLDHPVFHAWYNQCDNTLLHAWDSFIANDYANALLLRNKVFSMLDSNEEDAQTSRFLSSPESRVWTFAHTAFISALTGAYDQALHFCQKAITLGWDKKGYEHMKQEQPFSSLSTIPDGIRFLTQVQQLFVTSAESAPPEELR